MREPYRFDPMTGEPLKKGGSLLKWIALGGTVVTVGAGATVGVMVATSGFHPFKNKKDIVSEALVEIVETMDEGYLEEQFGLKELRRRAAEESVVIGLEGQIRDIPGLEYLGSLGGGLTFTRDLENKAAMIGAQISVADMEAAAASLYMDGEVLALAAPELIDPVLTVYYKDNIGDQTANSYFCQQLNIYDEDMEYGADVAQTIYHGLLGEKKYFDLKDIYERYKTATKANEEFLEGMEVTSIDSKKLLVNGKKKKCRGYDVVIQEKAIGKWIGTMGEYLVEDDQINENEVALLTDLLTVFFMLKEDCHYSAARPWAEGFRNEILKTVESGSEDLEELIRDHLDDVEMTLYVDNKGHAVSLSFNTSVDYYGTLDVEGEFTFAGGEIPTINMEGMVELSQNREKVTCSLEKKEEETKNQWNTELNLNCNLDGEKIKLSLEGIHDKENDEFEVNIHGKADTFELSSNMEGFISEHKKGEALTVEIDRMKVKGTGLNWDGSISGTYFIRPLSEKLSAPEGEVFDIFREDRTGWEKLEMDLSAGLQEIRKEFSANGR